MIEIKYKKDGILVEDTFVSLTDIKQKCIVAKVKEEDLVLITYRINRRFSDIVTKFVTPSKNKDRILELTVGKYAYFGEIEGKYSEVYGDIEAKDVSVDPEIDSVVSFLLEGKSYYSENDVIDAIVCGGEMEHDNSITEEEEQELIGLIYYDRD